MKISTHRHLRALKHGARSPKEFLFQSLIFRWVALFLLLIGFFLLMKGPFFRIRDISCQNQDGRDCDPAVVAELHNHVGRSTFLINTKDIQAKLAKANPAYRNIFVMAKLPNELTVQMTDKSEYFSLKPATASASFIVDQNLLIVDKLENPGPNLFTIIANTAVNYGVGDQITDDTLTKTYELATILQNHYLPFNDLTLTSPTMIIALLPDGKRALFTATEDLSRQVTSLQLILSKATISPEPREIDLRFDKPVLKY